MAFPKALFFCTSNRVSSPSSWDQHAWRISFRLRQVIRLPAASAATLRSSLAFHSMNSSISGWSMLRVTIFAARRVVPPDLIAPAARSPILRKLISPEDFPPPERDSPLPRRLEKLLPVPDPNLNSRASCRHKSMIPPSPTRSSSTERMKQACGCGRS